MASRKRGSKEQAPRWAFMLFGLSIGLIVALVVYLMSGDSNVALDEPAPAAAAREPEAEPARETRNAPSPAAEEVEEEFSFFRTLPESEVVVPEGGGGPARSVAEPAQEYIIQAGSFADFAEADSAQARLALLGIESKVERAIVGNEIYHRVIIGPLSDRGEIAATVRRLNAENIESMPPKPVPN